jgi:hypothetical protein
MTSRELSIRPASAAVGPFVVLNRHASTLLTRPLSYGYAAALGHIG